VPVLGRARAGPLARELDLSLALRSERYSPLIHSTTPTVGLRLRPTEHVRLTLKSSKSFRTPSAGDVDTSRNSTILAPWPDGTAPGGVRTVLLASGGNPDVKEERADSRAVGLGWSADW